MQSVYLIDHDSHCKDCISFIDIRNLMILRVKKMLQGKRYKQGSIISTAGRGIQNTDQILVNTQC